MTKPLRLSRTDARRLAVRAQLLTKERPTDLLDVVHHLTSLQHDQCAHVAPSADLVLWSRLGASYDPADLEDEIAAGRLVFLRGLLRPVEDIALYRAEMAAWPGPGRLREWQEDVRDWVDANERCRQDILRLLLEDGPIRARDIPDTCDVPWRSTGWTNNKNVQRLIDFMVQRGEVAAVGREGTDRLWDLAERVYPDDPVPPVEEARAELARRNLRSLGLARPFFGKDPVEPETIGDIGRPVVIEGLRGEWRADPEPLDVPFRGRAAVLSPLDRLIHDRKRMVELFEFDYQLEMYKPAAKRRWGYWAMPILYGDRLVGKLDCTSERDAGVLRVDAVHEDEPFTKTMRAAVDREIAGLAAWLGLELDRA
jgi:uncharacterized protein